MFIGGAEPRGAPAELRVQSLRGALRWWLRALLAGRDLGLHKDSGKLWQQEATVFGSTDHASPLNLGLIPSAMHSAAVGKRSKDSQKPSGVDYLFYGMHSGRDYAAREYFEEDLDKPDDQGRSNLRNFQLTLQPRPGVEDGSTAMQQALSAVWLLMRFGGLGSRSRHGAGTFVNTPPLKWDGLPPFGGAASSRSYVKLLHDGLNLLTGHDWGKPPTPGKVSPFPTLHPDYCTIVVVNSTHPREYWRSYDDVMEALGLELQRFRTANHSSQLAAFGLPATISGTSVAGRAAGQKFDRSASPLHLRVTRLGKREGQEREFIAIFILFHTNLLPSNATLSNGQPVPDQRIIHQFLDSLKRNPAYDCIMLGEAANG